MNAGGNGETTASRHQFDTLGKGAHGSTRYALVVRKNFHAVGYSFLSEAIGSDECPARHTAARFPIGAGYSVDHRETRAAIQARACSARSPRGLHSNLSSLRREMPVPPADLHPQGAASRQPRQPGAEQPIPEREPYAFPSYAPRSQLGKVHAGFVVNNVDRRFLWQRRNRRREWVGKGGWP